MVKLLAVIALAFSTLTGCAGISSVRLAAGYGPFHAEIEIKLQQAKALRAANGPDCPVAEQLEREARALGAIEVEGEDVPVTK